MIEYRLFVDEADPELEIRRGHEELSVAVGKSAGEALGAEVSSALFDRVRTCDNHCEFCFIYQLPKGMRKSLYLKDDDYRLSFLYGNFTTLTRFTELDLERVLAEGLSPLFVSIHSHRPRAAGPDAQKRTGGDRRCAGCGLCSTGGSRCTDRWWSAPGSTTARRWRRRWPGWSTSTRNWPPWPVSLWG